MNQKNLHDAQAIEKMKAMAEAIDFAVLCTNLSAQPFHAVPMSTKKVDNEGNIWFLSGNDSNHNSHIACEEAVELIYSDPSSMQFLNVFGSASIHTDPSILQELYGSTDDAWFDGIDDPNLTAIRVAPLAAHYWDTKGSKMMALLKMGVAAVTGNQPDLAEHGDLTV